MCPFCFVGVGRWTDSFLICFTCFFREAASMLLQKLHIDDPVDASPVHGFCGAWGVIAAGLFDWGRGIDHYHGWSGFGCMENDDGDCQKNIGGIAIGVQFIMVLVIVLWSGTLSAIGFFLLKITGLLRISDHVEEVGFDSHHHSPPKAYALGEKSLSPSKVYSTMTSESEATAWAWVMHEHRTAQSQPAAAGSCLVEICWRWEVELLIEKSASSVWNHTVKSTVFIYPVATGMNSSQTGNLVSWLLSWRSLRASRRGKFCGRVASMRPLILVLFSIFATRASNGSSGTRTVPGNVPGHLTVQLWHPKKNSHVNPPLQFQCQNTCQFPHE